ncbi:MAG: hypothetical protein DI585_01630 [Pseudomonas fluorescens]|nr:MAG: hypothetical protein DI585_01630 [Pseudomonas fluorescens]
MVRHIVLAGVVISTLATTAHASTYMNTGPGTYGEVVPDPFAVPQHATPAPAPERRFTKPLFPDKKKLSFRELFPAAFEDDEENPEESLDPDVHLGED